MAWNMGLMGAALSSAPAVDFDLLETTILTSNVNSVNFTGLDSYTDYKDLHVRVIARSTRGGDADTCNIRFNNDSSNSYITHRVTADGSLSIITNTNDSSQRYMQMAATTSGAGVFGGGTIDIFDFLDSSKNTSSMCKTTLQRGTSPILRFSTGSFLKTDPISQISFFPIDGSDTFVSGSRFSIYGIKGGA